MHQRFLAGWFCYAMARLLFHLKSVCISVQGRCRDDADHDLSAAAVWSTCVVCARNISASLISRLYRRALDHDAVVFASCALWRCCMLIGFYEGHTYHDVTSFSSPMFLRPRCTLCILPFFFSPAGASFSMTSVLRQSSWACRSGHRRYQLGVDDCLARDGFNGARSSQVIMAFSVFWEL